ncbi:MAG: DUF2252 family protein [Myxococcota bacterium]
MVDGPSAGSGRKRFQLTPEQLAAIGQRPRVASSLASSPYAFFRFQHAAFSLRVCEAFADERARMPIVNLHGDAHLEQYAVTRRAHGLDDFDEAGIGPAVVDLVRFIASLHVACADADFACDPERAAQAFLDQYRIATLDPGAVPSPPALVTAVRASAPMGADAFLAWGEGLMTPLPEDLRADITKAWQRSTGLMRAEDPSRPASFYRLQRAGRIGIGIGSALNEKFLLRIEGPTAAPHDDLLVEVKQQAPALPGSCVYRPPTGGVLYPQLMQRRLGRLNPEVLAFVPHVDVDTDRPPWMCWLRSWDEAYREVRRGDLRGPTDLEQLARDVGHQLGDGHCRDLTAPFEQQHRRAQVVWLDGKRDRVLALGAALAEELRGAWRSLPPALAQHRGSGSSGG